MTNGPGKSDRPTVPEKSPNNAGQPAAEGMEERGLATGNLPQQNASRTPRRRSQNGRVLWDRMRRLITRWLPLPFVCHPYPLRRMGVIT
jgi:hypothetical protein